MEHDEPGISAVAETTSASPAADPLARTALGTYRGVATDRADVWRGIRYARPPLDDLRWRRARPLIPPDGDADTVIDAQMFGAVCPQELNPAVRLGPDVVMDEDCLFLNVWTPPGGRRSMRTTPSHCRSWSGCTAERTCWVPAASRTTTARRSPPPATW